ncbi:MAG: transporter substrate-binding protein [Hyphomicrobiales bacterium]|nr:transporter substrate-binding protein [Hyphomicrobiales bacterium]MDB5595031.1 transporter substrate-binding protein [Hyphomicrobiales bacterium]
MGQHFSRRLIGLAGAALAACVFLVQPDARAQDWPPRQSTIVIGFGAGSAADLLARVIAEGLQKRTGATFLVENKPGAGGNVSVDTVVKGPSDGSMMLAAIFAPIIVNPMTMDVPYDAFRQLQPLTIMGTTPSVLVSSKKLGVKSVAQLRELVKANPGKYTFSSVGVGTIGHLSMEMLADQVGSKMIHVPFRSTPDSLNAVVQGEVDVATVALGTVEPQIHSGDVIGLAITSAQRWPSLPNVPTVAEAGIPDMPVDAWNALFLPAGVPKPIVERMYREVKAVIDDPDVQKRIMNVFYRPSGIPTAEFAGMLTREVEQWRPILGKLGLLKK